MTGYEALSFLAISPVIILAVMLLMAAAWCAVAAVFLPLWGICRAAAWAFSRVF